MPGAKCAFPDSGVTRREQFSSLAIFKYRREQENFTRKWRKRHPRSFAKESIVEWMLLLEKG